MAAIPAKDEPKKMKLSSKSKIPQPKKEVLVL